ncbi:NADH:flavin oxidoreductase, partial [Atractiella rhizophila]
NEKRPKTFEPLNIRGRTAKNRIWVSPMCQYSAEPRTGMPSDWHLVHLGSLAVKGCGIVMMEATSVLPNGLISPQDLGFWSDHHTPAFKRISDFIHSQGSLSAIQLGHAGRKASTAPPWLVKGRGEGGIVTPEDGGWTDVWGPTGGEEGRWDAGHVAPIAMTETQIIECLEAFVAAAKRADAAGFDIIELHGAHGYLLNAFMSPLSNRRTDKWGGSLENRMRFPLLVTEKVREVWPAEKPLFFRISCTEWDPRGEKDPNGDWRSWGIEQTVILCKELAKHGVDMIDASTGGNYSGQQIIPAPLMQVPFAERLKKEGLQVAAVGLITTPEQVEGILSNGKADAVFMARELLRHSDFVMDAAYYHGVAVAPAHQYQVCSSLSLSRR